MDAHQAAALEQLCKRIEWAGDLVALFISVDAAVALRALLAERDELAKDAARLDWLERQSKSYGFEGIHEGNAWEIYGAYRSIREAIDSEIAALTNKD